MALGEIDPTDLSTLKVPLVPSDSSRKNSTGLPRLSFPFKRISSESPAFLVYFRQVLQVVHQG